MGATLFKQPGDPKTVEATLDCVWCGSQFSGDAIPLSKSRREVWLLANCPAVPCRRPMLVLVPLAGNLDWAHIDTTVDYGRHVWGPVDVFPAERPSYTAEGVDPAIAQDLQEAKRCAAARFYFGAALVGRRALEAAVAASGGKGKDLKAQIDSLADSVITASLKDGAHDVRLTGNDAAHLRDVTLDDVAALLDFTEDILEALFVHPHRAKLRAEARAAKGGKR